MQPFIIIISIISIISITTTTTTTTTTTITISSGFRHKKTKIEYHHATAQTDSERKVTSHAAVKFHRDSQTTTQATRSIQVLTTPNP